MRRDGSIAVTDSDGHKILGIADQLIITAELNAAAFQKLVTNKAGESRCFFGHKVCIASVDLIADSHIDRRRKLIEVQLGNLTLGAQFQSGVRVDRPRRNRAGLDKLKAPLCGTVTRQGEFGKFCNGAGFNFPRWAERPYVTDKWFKPRFLNEDIGCRETGHRTCDRIGHAETCVKAIISDLSAELDGMLAQPTPVILDAYNGFCGRVAAARFKQRHRLPHAGDFDATIGAFVP